MHAPRPELSILHEIGHYLDREALGRGRGFGSEDGDIPEIVQSIRASVATRWLDGLTTRTHVRLQLPNRARAQVLPVDPAVVRYLRAPAELFARAYAQFIAVSSDDARLRHQLDEVRRDPILGPVYHVQWDDGDFVAIARAFEHELRRRRWIA